MQLMRMQNRPKQTQLLANVLSTSYCKIMRRVA